MDREEVTLNKLVKDREFAKSILEDLSCARERIKELESELLLREEAQLIINEDYRDKDVVHNLLEIAAMEAVKRLENNPSGDVQMAISGLKMYISLYLNEEA